MRISDWSSDVCSSDLEDEHGLSQHDALIDACRKRAQPVIMTTLAMGAGMMPIALGFSGDSSFRAPMAIAVIGGLITSTLLSLIVIPAAFTVIDDLGEWVSTKFHRRPQHPVPDYSGGWAPRHPPQIGRA